MTRSRFLMILPALFLCLLAVSCGKKEKEDPNVVELNFGHFPNVTHVQGLVAHHFSRQGKGWFEERLKEATGKDVRINWYVYNAGPSAMEAVFARSIELAYVGPSPAINAFVRSRGEDIRMIAGAVEGGAALDAMTREQLYQDIQEIHLRCGMTIVFVTHNMREAVCLGDRVVLLTPHPGRVCEDYFVDFPHPRDINSSDLAELSARITRDLKGATA